MVYRLRELNTAKSVWQKLGVTVLLLVFGILLAPLFLLAPSLNPEPTAKWITKIAVDLIAGYYLVLLVFVWWRPKWLQRVYEAEESKLVRWGYLFNLLLLSGLVAAAIFSLFEFFAN